MQRHVRPNALWLSAIIPLAVLSACAGVEQPGRPVPRPRPPVVVQPAPVAAANYFRSAASIDLFEIRSSELAQVRARNARLREFASMVIRAHKGTAAQLSMAGRRLNLLPSATLLPRHQAMLDQLRSARDFDSTYRRQQQSIHREALALHSSYAARGRSPTLRPVAANAVPIIRRHIAMLQRL